MEREAEDPVNNGHLVTCSDSDSSKELCVTESPSQSHYMGSESDAEYPADPQPTDIPESYPESPKCLQSQSREQQALSEQIGGQEDDSYQEMDNIHNIESPDFNTMKTTLSSHSARSNQEPISSGRVSRIQSASSPSSDGCGDVTPALTLTPEHRQGDSRRQGPCTGARAKENWTLDSPEEGGYSEAPPAPISSGISSAGAEQAEKWNSESDTDLCRPERRRARRARHIVSESEKHIKETKSKCKRIALTLTDAPNPQNKGALLFNKRRQRVKKFTLVSYGTHESSPDSEDQTEEDAEEVRSTGLNCVATSDSEPEEEHSVHPQEHIFDLNWEDREEMEGLTETTGKGVMMFAKRRQRMDEIAIENEELRRKGLPVDGIMPEYRDIENAYNTELYVQSTNQESQNYTDESTKQNIQYQEDIQQMNHLSNVPRPLVPNRTAKPFLGFQTRASAPLQPPGGGITGPVTKKPELKFKVPVPINTSPQVWSPTGDIIASRDERISVPAVKRGTLPESKRRGTNKQTSGSVQVSDPYLQNKGDRRSYIEPEEDLFSLGAEACNFMQPRTVKLKNPPPVAPKPTINQKCPPWLKKSPPPEPCHPTRSPLSPPSPNPVVPHTHLQQQEGAHPYLTANHWAPVNSPPQSQLQPTMANRSPQPARSPVSIDVLSPTYSPRHPSSPSRIKSSVNSGSSGPPQLGDSHIHSLKPAPASPKGQASDRGISGAVDGPPLKGKGAQLFAKRQSRMEKFVVTADTVQANKTPVRSPSPISLTSLPNSWKSSPNVRAPPNSYNPLLAPFYPPSAAKQPPSTSPKIKPKEIKVKPKAPPKHIDTLDVMRHQPYQLDSSLFKYDAHAADKSPSPKSSTASISKVTPTPKPSSGHSKAKASTKSSGWVSSQYSSTLQHAKSAESLLVDKQLGEMPTATSAANHISKNQAASAQPTYNQGPPAFEDSLASFTPASLIARGARQMAPQPKFSAKKPAVVAAKLWKPVYLH